MIGVMSLWTRPHIEKYENYSEPFVMLWAYSLAKARRLFSRIVLVTDAPGRKMMKDFPYDGIREDLEEPFLPETARGIWAAGKLKAYSMMREEFCHFDGDVIMHKRPHVFGSDVFAQSDEPFEAPPQGSFEDDPEAHILHGLYLNNGINGVPWIPGHARFSLTRRYHRPYNAGIIGGKNWEFFNEYANQALDICRHPLNQQSWKEVNGVVASCFVEQYLFGSLAETAGQYVTVLFPGSVTKNETYMQNIGYAHLLGDAKHNPAIMERVYNNMQRDFPYLYKIVKAMNLPARTILRPGHHYHGSR